MKLAVILQTIILFTQLIRSICVVKLKFLKTQGYYNLNGIDRPCFFLGPEQLEVLEASAGGIQICDLVPLSSEASSRNLLPYQFGFSSCAELCNRDNGIYDNLPYDWAGPGAKKKLYDYCNFEAYKLVPSKFTTVSHAFLDGVKNFVGANFHGMLVDVVDERSSGSVQLGASLSVTRIVSDVRETKIVNMYVDEMVRLACDLNEYVSVDKSIYERCCLDAQLVEGINGMEIKAKPAAVFKSTNTNAENNEDADEDFTPVWQIYDASALLRMTAAEKRDLLRRSGISPLPRPREGEAALDQYLTEYMDDAVRSEYRRLKATSSSDTRRSNIIDGARTKSNGAPTWDEGSQSRVTLLRLMREFLSSGNLEQAKQLRAEFAMRTGLRADPTQSEGAYDRYLDQDDWYMRARRKSMAPKPKPPQS